MAAALTAAALTAARHEFDVVVIDQHNNPAGQL
jgi:flavin-dependent dehydrogenase